eukprot:TRINITY_DN12011_c0_g1_i1.p1 TRINITY_DN12011_c0_g1~~TRINITY_DN12011_c0_g1_i1.p1  ORF type:complete len:600 (-),score=68.50 TRINITY_DN12011_c0_g1_i1:133-1932(-)
MLASAGVVLNLVGLAAAVRTTHDTGAKASTGANTLRASRTCSTSCADSDEVNPWLQEGCPLYDSCMTAAEERKEYYPHFTTEWCDNWLTQLTMEACDREEGDGLGSQKKLNKMTAVLGVVSKVTPDDGAHFKGCGDATTCETCLATQHRFGVRAHDVTSGACEWTGAACVQLDISLTPQVVYSASSDCPAPSTELNASEAESMLEESSGRKGRKVGLLIAWDYKASEGALWGTAHDLEAMYKKLLESNYSAEDIYVMTDSQRAKKIGANNYGVAKPSASVFRKIGHFLKISELYDKNTAAEAQEQNSAADVLHVLSSVIATLRKGDEFFFFFSGHGYGKVTDYNGDELNGYDEALLMPNDDLLVDDAFYARLLKIPRGVKVSLVVDACHSEGFSDLPFNYDPDARTWCTDTAETKALPQADIVYLASSHNSQTSVDRGSFKGGALTHYLEKYGWESDMMYKYLNKMIENFKSDAHQYEQTPRMAAFPSFPDCNEYSPFIGAVGDRYPARKKKSRSHYLHFSGLQQRMAPICTHGLGEYSRDMATRAQRYFVEDVSLGNAKLTVRGSSIEGWPAGAKEKDRVRPPDWYHYSHPQDHAICG